MDASPQTEGMAPERSIVPTVERRRDGLSGWAIGLGVAVLGLVLFGVLDARRRQPEIASTAVRPIDQVDLPDTTPVLDIPPEPAPSPIVTASPPPPVARSTPSPVPLRSAPPPAPVFDRPTAIVALPTSVTRPTAGAGATGAAIVFDGSTAKSGASDAAGGAASGTVTPGVVGSTERVRAGMFANRSTTVLQGTLIPAVLETAFDSTRPGFARALVSRNVVGFDGTRVLIPRGSRLIGEYRSDAAPGRTARW